MFGTKWFKCPVMVFNPKTGKTKKCNRKFSTLEQMMKHADRSHGGRGREL